ncbi:MAG: hypothetical protein JSS82_09930 [Bacteroidetes bacterium]|nr:hypothetical protein [Bacteroidota bacterium]
MTTTTEEKQKRSPALYIFKDENGQSNNVGAAFNGKNGKGFDIKIGDTWYKAYPPKTKPATGEGA